MDMVNNKRNAAVMVDDDRDWETIISTEQPEETPLEAAKLGRQRPDVFRSTWCEVAFVASILGSMAMGVSLTPTHYQRWVGGYLLNNHR